MKNKSLWWIRIPVVFFVAFGLMEYAIDSGDKPAIIAYPISQLFLLLILLITIAIELVLGAIENVMFQTLSEEAKERYLASKAKKREWTWAKNTYNKMLGSKPMEVESEIVLDHDYDGIRELDNKLPPWWVYMFYASIVFGVIYLIRFHVYNDYNQDLEYEQEVAIAKKEIEEYKKNAKDLVDENTVELLTDATDIKAGEKVFQSNCIACHMADGGGGIGPNLTDQYWILGGGVKNVFRTVSEGGRDGKGMIAWKQTLKPVEIAQVTSYVLTTLNGKEPANPKPAEGDLWVDPNTPANEIPAQVIDSSSVVMN